MTAMAASTDSQASAATRSTILAGDIGGTKTDLTLFGWATDGSLRPLRSSTFVSAEHAGLTELLTAFLSDTGTGSSSEASPPPRSAALGVPGPVVGDRVRLTNLPWTIEPARVARDTGIGTVRLLNDLEAAAHGVATLGPEDLAVLNPGVRRSGHCGLVAAGTGLGQAILFWDGERHHPTATEGGHTGFGPRDEEQIALHRFLGRRYDRVSWERVLSGSGLEAIYEFLVLERGMPASEQVDARVRAGEDLAAAVGEAGIGEDCGTCRHAVDLFLRLYGAQSANLALTTLAVGGIYVWGGIIRKLLPRAVEGPFLEGFLDVGRFRDLMREIPVWAVLDERAAVAGAARVAVEAVKGPGVSDPGIGNG
jgi:glucokinase